MDQAKSTENTKENGAMQTWPGQTDKNFQTKVI